MSDRSSVKSGRGVFPCYFCVKTFKLRACLETHVLRQHPGNAVSRVVGDQPGWPAWTNDPTAIQELFEMASDFRRRGCIYGFRYRDCPKLLCDAIVGAVGTRTGGDLVSVSGSSSEKEDRTQRWLGEAPSSVASLESFAYDTHSSSSVVMSSSAQSRESESSTVDEVTLESILNAQPQPPQEVSAVLLSAEEIDELFRFAEEPQQSEDF